MRIHPQNMSPVSCAGTCRAAIRAGILAQAVAVILMMPAVAGQAPSAASGVGNTASDAEVTAFMKSLKENPNAAYGISPSARQVSLLLGAIQREPGGPWIYYLTGICFGSEHSQAQKLPPDQRAPAYARAIEYLGAAKEALAKGAQSDPQNREWKDKLGTADAALALAYVESGTRNKEARAIAEGLLASNTVTNWNYGNLIYNMHSLLGRIDLREGNLAGAKRHLAASASTPGSPQLNSFGPDFVLAAELLEKGERDAVLAHLDAVGVFWGRPGAKTRPGREEPDKIEDWKRVIRAGKVPDEHQWRFAGLSSVDSTPVDETAAWNARRRACINQLTMIAGAKRQWALGKQQTGEATPAVVDLVAYFPAGKLPKCPEGGSYVVGKVRESPRCSVAGHELATGQK